MARRAQAKARLEEPQDGSAAAPAKGVTRAKGVKREPAAPRDAARLPAGLDLSAEALARRMLARHQATIRVKNPKVAVARLAHIAETTLTLANASGFHSTSLRDLSEHSGLSMGALYAYFDSKETLLAMILDTVAGVVEEVLGQPPEDLTGPLERLRWLIATHVALTEAMLDWFTFVYMEAKAFPAAARAQAVASEQRTEALIAHILEEAHRRRVPDG